MKKVLFLLLILVFPFSALAGNIGDKFESAGYLETKVWLRNNTDSRHQYLASFKNTFDLKMQYEFSPQWVFFFHPRYFYDAAYDTRDDDKFDRSQDEMGRTRGTAWLRECYLDYISPNLDIRLGKQQVVWGQMDVPILDKVMPLDLTNWFIPDLADIRIPLWMAKIEYSPRLNSTLQFLIIPDFEPSRVAPPGAPFSFAAYNAFYNFKQYLKLFGGNAYVDYQEPSSQFENSTFGVRWRSMLGDLEYTLNWLYSYTRSSYTYSAGGSFPVFYTNRRHKRIQLAGFSLGKTFTNPGPLNGITLKSEFAFIHDEPTYYGTSGTREVTKVSDKYNWGFSAEKTIATNWTVNFQFMQFIANHPNYTTSGGTTYKMLDNATYGVIDKIENNFVLKVMTDFMHERLKPEITILYQDDNQGRIVPKVNFELRDNLWFELGYAHFFGRPDTNNGQFRNNDQLMLSAKYTF